MRNRYERNLPQPPGFADGRTLRPMVCSWHFSEVKIRASWQMWPGGGPGKLDTLEAGQ